MFQLNNLTPLVKKRKRIGRGGSRGGTSGKGHKGQKARAGGGVRLAFEGGQMPLYRRLPKRGFSNMRFKKLIKIISLDRLNMLFNDGDSVSKEILIKKGFIKNRKNNKKIFLKILGDGTLSKKLTISSHLFSKAAVKAIENAGGRVIQETM